MAAFLQRVLVKTGQLLGNWPKEEKERRNTPTETPGKGNVKESGGFFGTLNVGTMTDLLVCCGADVNFTEKLVDLGQNVTLQCEVAVKDALWFLMKPSEPPVYILRSFSSKILVPQYSNRTFSKIFSLQYNSNLFIHNISANELGVYYCVYCDSPPLISRGIRLYTQNHAAGCVENLHTSGLKNQTSKPDHHQSEENGLTLLPFLILSVIIICTLVITVTALASGLKNQTSKPDHQQSEENGLTLLPFLIVSVIINCTLVITVTACHLPRSLAIVKTKAHSHDNTTEAKGNSLADRKLTVQRKLSIVERTNWTINDKLTKAIQATDLLVCCGAAEGFTEKLVDLGQNVTLQCEVAVKDVYWFLMKPSEPPVFILRSFS
ncbi:hypothetical protein C0J50_10337, partial [Silurus asotus]